ncbi:MAG TPA: glycosyl hydrolase family 65 protein, partial [Longimicrobium sp.]|nr:glycosyl hydrolase family 65 protein [Longimicrobium sp.]
SLRTIGLASAALVAMAGTLQAQTPLYRSNAFTVTDTSVTQGRWTATALSRDSIVSTYPRAGREMHFRFSLNGADNEFPSGTEHTLYVRPANGRIESPLYVFGQEQPPFIPTPEAYPTSEEGVAQVTIRLDLRHVLRELRQRGSYDPPYGEPIRRLDAVYAIGDVEPLSWDARALRPGGPAQLRDANGDGIYELTLPVEAQYTRPLAGEGRAIWTRRADLSAFPRLQSPERLVDALYRMSLEELTQLVRDDGALSAGAKWPGVWTRDVAYSSVLALAIVAPDAVRRSLMAKVDSAGRIIQDTGTGGSWPVSTDRMTWALAAWELYAVTGDRDWLRTAFDVIDRSAMDDLHAVFDPRTALARGETSFMDWREQSYPRWMDPRDIAQSAGIGTNVVHFATWHILAEMARLLGEEWGPGGMGAGHAQAMNEYLWMPEQGYYGVFRYGRLYPVLAPRSDVLGNALAILYGAVDGARRDTLAARMPVVEFGAPTFWPYIPNIPHYHNGALWPFVSAFWTWASAEAGNTAGVEHGLASLYRPAALFLTNKENMVASTGHFDGTELNSDRQLWSVAGNLAASYRVLFGMRFDADRLRFAPMVPPAYGGERTLSNLRYRGATLTVTVRGHGDGIARVRIDGRPAERAEVPATLTGAHTVEIEMNGRWPETAINLVPNRFSPETPAVRLEGGALAWEAVPGSVRYVVHRNGAAVETTAETRAAVAPGEDAEEWQVLAVDSTGLESFLSEPVRVAAEDAVIVAQPRGAPLEREHAGFTGEGYVRLTRTENTEVEVPVRVACGGEYAVEARYANGSGPINTDAKAAIRTLRGPHRVWVLVMPQRGTDRWTDWGYSTAVSMYLEAGEHVLRIAFEDGDENMDGRVNTALLDHLRLTRLSGDCR